jgi:hypothetical protein
MTLFPSEEAEGMVNLAAIGAPPTKTRGFVVALGKPLTFHVGFFSDAPVPEWTISYDFPAETALFNATTFSPIGNGSGTVAIAQPKGKNGDKTAVTVTVKKKGDAGFHVMAITWDPPPASQASYAPHYLPILLVDE